MTAAPTRSFFWPDPARAVGRPPE